MISRLSRYMTSFVSRFLPDPLIFAALLTFFLFTLAWGLTDTQPLALIKLWGDGFWNLLAFAMQMALIVVTGNALATSPPVKSILVTIASLAKTPTQAAMLVTFVGCLACITNWGFGLVVGAMLAKEVARQVEDVDYGLLIACAYIAFMTWGGGFSGSMPLMAATPDNPVSHYLVTSTNPHGIIPISQTMLSPCNIFVIGMLVICLPLLVRFMVRTDGVIKKIDRTLLMPELDFQKKTEPKQATFAEKLEESRILSLLIAALGITYIIMYLHDNGMNITINTVNLIFLTTGILLHKTPMAYMRAVTNAAKTTAGIIIQFPFYAGIQLMMEHSGLGGMITEFFINIANQNTFPVLAFFSSGIINLAVPSGGGHWVIQGPFVIPAAQALGADLGKSVMAIAYGEQWMNMLQPFWALPALAIAGLGVRDIMGYCMTAMIVTTPIFLIGLYFL